jgi:hypothetical protein
MQAQRPEAPKGPHCHHQRQQQQQQLVVLLLLLLLQYRTASCCHRCACSCRHCCGWYVGKETLLLLLWLQRSSVTHCCHVAGLMLCQLLLYLLLPLLNLAC